MKNFFNNLNPTTRRYILSSAVTFVSTFLLFVGFNLENMGTEVLTWSAISGVIMAGVRAGIKALAESYMQETADK